MKYRNLMVFVGCCSFLLSSEAYAQPSQKTVVVGSDDTVYGIAYEHGLPTRAIVSANNLKPPYTLQAGQTLIIPMPNQHIVGQNETAQSISETYGVSADVLAAENNVRSPAYITPGTVLTIPSRDTTTMTKALKPELQEEISSSLR